MMEIDDVADAVAGATSTGSNRLRSQAALGGRASYEVSAYVLQ